MRLQEAYLRAGVENNEQLEACLSCPEVSLIYIELGYFPPSKWEGTVRRCHAEGKLAAARFPHILRAEADLYLTENMEKLKAFDAFLVRTPEELGWLYEKERTEFYESLSSVPLIFDYTMSCFNEKCAQAFSEYRPESITASLELNMKELKYFAHENRINTGTPIELVVYGRAPVMATAQCIKNTVKGCDRTPCLMYLKDRMGCFLPVKNNCAYCYNTVLNTKPTVIFDLEKEIEAIAPESVRYEFTTETGGEVRELLSGSFAFLKNDFTRGHFRRGVE